MLASSSPQGPFPQHWGSEVSEVVCAVAMEKGEGPAGAGKWPLVPQNGRLGPR